MTFVHRNEWIGYGLLAIAAVAVSLPLYPHKWHLFLHIAGAVIFLGNIIVTGVWMLMAERTCSPSVIHFSAKAVIHADFLFTLPGVLLVLLNGLAMAYARWGGVLLLRDVNWITVAVALFTMSGIIWVGALLGLQHRMAVLSAPPGNADSLPPQFYSTLHKWYFWGVLAIILPIGSLYLMVVKPTFG